MEFAHLVPAGQPLRRARPWQRYWQQAPAGFWAAISLDYWWSITNWNVSGVTTLQ
jgi:hypothetical protein